jgi:hypothetical protein
MIALDLIFVGQYVSSMQDVEYTYIMYILYNICHVLTLATQKTIEQTSQLQFLRNGNIIPSGKLT